MDMSLFRQATQSLKGSTSPVEEAVRLAIELSLICPKCGEWNRDPASVKPLIEYRNGEASCSCCGTSWRPR
jgi:hypothetical protein